VRAGRPARELRARGLGFGLDLRWGDRAGFDVDGAGRDRLGPALRAFLETLERPGARFDHAFFSWQPRDRGRLRADDYAPAWDELAAALPVGLPVGLHHTALDLAALAPPPRAALLDFTNTLCERYGLDWINEDVGFWSVAGRPVPYPLPPRLDAVGLRACARNVRECQRGLARPLVLEFPGFDASVPFVEGALDAYDFFRALAEETGAPVALDVAHLLSWRWWRGHRGEALYEGLDRLPLGQAFEVHMSGCEIVGGRVAGCDDRHFVDAHHGRLIDEQLELLGRLLPLCPSLRAVTFEDPRLDADGELDAGSRASLHRLEAATSGWRRKSTVSPTPPALAAPPTPIELDRAEPAAEALEAALEARVAPTRLALVRDRAQRGTGKLADAFPRCIAGWRSAHPEDARLDALFARFLASPALSAWREQPGVVGGACLEACFAELARAEALAPPEVCEEELLSVLLRALAVAPDPAFEPPPEVRRAPGGWFAVSRAAPPILHAALDGRYLRGPITPLVAAILAGGDAGEAPAAVRDRLVELGLLAQDASDASQLEALGR
jgi:uncharacterized protein (UPF0276 family)